ncbi:MAG: acyloxyacyl hydrolase [Akkermansiaceae bacterium]|nr:acyloxyacyl hydrolase [Akkermansiaceae bacterium]MCP5551769.1 acyloxyacyl hydrolase [Akkermansiaceae bacterium]
MKSFPSHAALAALFLPCFAGSAAAQQGGAEASASSSVDYAKAIAPRPREPWEGNEVDFETGAIWRITNSTPIDYVVLPQMLTFKGPMIYLFDWGDEGDKLVVRSRLSFLGEYFLEGPETYFFGFHGSPSIEWWNAERDLSVFYSVGGGIGFLDSTAVEGGHGQDFNFTWFMHLGLRHRLAEGFYFQYGAYFQHTSNRGLNERNPGLNALGPMVGLSWEW